MEWNTIEPANVNQALIFAYTYFAPFLYVLGKQTIYQPFWLKLIIQYFTTFFYIQ